MVSSCCFFNFDKLKTPSAVRVILTLSVSFYSLRFFSRIIAVFTGDLSVVDATVVYRRIDVGPVHGYEGRRQSRDKS